MKNGDNFREIKITENSAVILVLFVIIIIIFPSLMKMFDNVFKMSAKTNTKNVIEITKYIYTDINLIDDVPLPFKIVYKKNGYILYANGQKYIPVKKTKLDEEGKLPKGGSITIKTDGEVVIKNLKFGLYKCNSENDKVICEL